MFYLRQLVALTGLPKAPSSVKVQSLMAAGTATPPVEGTALLPANQTSAIFPVRERILLKTFGAAHVMSRLFAAIGT